MRNLPLSGKRNDFHLGLLLTASMLALAGCVSSPDATLKAENAATSDVGTQRAGKPEAIAMGDTDGSAETTADSGDAPDSVPGADADMAQTALREEAVAGETTPAELGGLTLQSTGINASRASIFSSRSPALPADGALPATDDGAVEVPAYAPTKGANPAFSNVYSRSQDQQPAAGATDDEVSRAADTGKDVKAEPVYGIAFRKNDYIGADDLPLSMAHGFYASSDLDAKDDEPVGLMKLASLSGMARTAAHGLKVQTGGIEVGCFKPKLVKMIKSAEAHFGTTAVVTSGYRSVSHNRRVGGAERSLHMTCDAADVQLEGVSKWELAAFLRRQPGRGGVGTYCHTASVHLDTGRARDWNWRCRRKEA